MGWIETSGGYAVALDGTRVLCRNAAGRTLKQVPSKLKDDAEVVRLRQLAEWLERHERECREQVDIWLVRSLPVPVALLARVWPDPAWRSVLRDLVVAPVAADGSADTARAGFLRDADPVRGLGIVDLDGDSVRLDPAEVGTVLIPHPVLLEDLAELREFAAELGVEQGAEQLFREVWRRPGRPRTLPRARPRRTGVLTPMGSSHSSGTPRPALSRSVTGCAGAMRCARWWRTAGRWRRRTGWGTTIRTGRR